MGLGWVGWYPGEVQTVLINSVMIFSICYYCEICEWTWKYVWAHEGFTLWQTMENPKNYLWKKSVHLYEEVQQIFQRLKNEIAD